MAKINNPNQNRYFCEIYEDLSFLQKKWLIDVKSLTRYGGSDKICEDSKMHQKLPKYLQTYLADLPKLAKTIGMLLKKKTFSESVVLGLICQSNHRMYYICYCIKIKYLVLSFLHFSMVLRTVIRFDLTQGLRSK